MTNDKQQIIDLEKRFWQSMKDKDPAMAKVRSPTKGLSPDRWGRCGSIPPNMPRYRKVSGR